MEAVVIAIWAVGSVVAVGGALTMMLVRRSQWKTIPRFGVKVKGPGPSLEEQENALDFFVAHWPEVPSLDGLHIEWRRGEWFFVGKQKASGKTVNKDYVVCANAEGVRVLFHELVHVHLWREDDDPDLHHRQQKLWDAMYEIQQAWEETEPGVKRWVN